MLQNREKSYIKTEKILIFCKAFILQMLYPCVWGIKPVAAVFHASKTSGILIFFYRLTMIIAISYQNQRP
jgi:hypothetical protein